MAIVHMARPGTAASCFVLFFSPIQMPTAIFVPTELNHRCACYSAEFSPPFLSLVQDGSAGASMHYSLFAKNAFILIIASNFFSSNIIASNCFHILRLAD